MANCQSSVVSSISAVSALVTLKDGKPVTTSLIVAESFNKNHRDVLRSIDAIVKSPAYQERGGLRNFAQGSYFDPRNNQTHRLYEMDRQGFEILAMGFTGDEALRWKFKYSDAFAAMEAELKKPATPDPLGTFSPSAQFAILEMLVDKAAKTLTANFVHYLRQQGERVWTVPAVPGIPATWTPPPPASPARRSIRPVKSDPWDEAVQTYVGNCSEVSSSEVLQHLGIEPDSQTQAQKNRIAHILKRLGFWSVVVNRGHHTLRTWQRGIRRG